MPVIRRTARKRNPEAKKRYSALCTADNVRFGSIPEKEHYLNKLKPLQKKGKIRSLKIHPKFYFEIDGDKYSSYTADFSFIETDTENLRVHDVKDWILTKKGLEPIVAREFVYQKALMRLQFGIIVLEV